MKNIKTFESFVNERLNRSDLKMIKNMGYDAKLSGGVITVTGENPWRDDDEYTFYWDGESVWCEGDDGGYLDYIPDEKITTPEQFSNAIEDPYDWD